MLTRNVNTELKVGIFTIFGIATVGIIGISLEGNPFSKKVQTFYTVLDNVSGVGPRTQVRTSGVPIGEVTSAEILPKGGAKINFNVDSKYQIPKGSFLELRTRGLLGDVFIEIVRNDKSEEFLKAGDVIPKNKDQNDMSALIESMGSIAKDIKAVSTTLSSVLGNQEGKSSLTNILRNVEQITLDTRELVSSERKNISATIQGFRDTAQKLGAMLDRNQGKVDQSLQSVADATRDFKAFAGELKNFVQGENREHIENIVAAMDESMQNIKTASSKVDLIVSKVEKGEGSLGQLISKEDTANDLRATLKSVQDLLRPATSLKIDLDYKGEVRTDTTDNTGRFGNHFGVRLSTRPDRYYLLGISDSPASRKVKTTETQPTVTDPATGKVRVVEREEVSEDRQRLRFNVQFAKRFNDVGVRFGLFESYAGVAGDLYLFSDTLQASVEAFNFGDGTERNEKGEKAGVARVKAYANYFVTPNIYVTGGADNIIKTKKPLAFVGAGLRFTEDDFKAVVGAAALAR